MRIASSKSEFMVLSRKRVDYPLSAENVLLPEVKECKELNLVYKLGQKKANQKLKWTLYGSVVEKRDLRQISFATTKR